MFTAYVVVAALAAAANAYGAFVDLTRAQWILTNMDRYGVPHTWLPSLGIVKAAAAAGLLAGIAVPPIGVAAAIGLVLYFVGALGTVVRSRCYADIPYPGVYLALAVGALVLGLAA